MFQLVGFKGNRFHCWKYVLVFSRRRRSKWNFIPEAFEVPLGKRATGPGSHPRGWLRLSEMIKGSRPFFGGAPMAFGMPRWVRLLFVELVASWDCEERQEPFVVQNPPPFPHKPEWRKQPYSDFELVREPRRKRPHRMFLVAGSRVVVHR